MITRRRSSTVPQLAASMVAFTACALLLESGGLYDWAQRLDLGRLRSIALPVATRLHTAVAHTGLEAIRTKSITALARAGWSDDPAAAAGDDPKTAVNSPGTVTIPVPPATQPGTVPESRLNPPSSMPKPATLPVAGDPPLLSNLPALAPADARTVALAGDSMMAVGLSATILRQSAKYPNLHFLKAFKSGTGLARPEVFNWMQEYPAMIAGRRPDVVLVAIGANDGQGFVEDGVTYPFGSDGWQTLYQQRVAAYLAMLTQSGARVVWIGLPPMKSSVYNAHIGLVNRIAYTVVQSNPQATWFSTTGLIGETDGSFRDFGLISGKQTRLRAADGIHMSDEGATLFTDKLLPWLSPPPTAPQPTSPKEQP